MVEVWNYHSIECNGFLAQWDYGKSAIFDDGGCREYYKILNFVLVWSGSILSWWELLLLEILQQDMRKWYVLRHKIVSFFPLFKVSGYNEGSMLKEFWWFVEDIYITIDMYCVRNIVHVYLAMWRIDWNDSYGYIELFEIIGNLWCLCFLKNAGVIFKNRKCVKILLLRCSVLYVIDELKEK